jgi:hypothetical protein
MNSPDRPRRTGMRSHAPHQGCSSSVDGSAISHETISHDLNSTKSPSSAPSSFYEGARGAAREGQRSPLAAHGLSASMPPRGGGRSPAAAPAPASPEDSEHDDEDDGERHAFGAAGHKRPRTLDRGQQKRSVALSFDSASCHGVQSSLSSILSASSSTATRSTRSASPCRSSTGVSGGATRTTPCTRRCLSASWGSVSSGWAPRSMARCM